MANKITPPIGTGGIYRLTAPYSTALVNSVTYTCMAARSLSELLNSGLDPYEEYYEPMGISSDTYDEHLLLDTAIVSLRSAADHWVFVPNVYIQSYPNQNGVKYTSVVLGISLGTIPDHMELASLKTVLRDAVRDTIGIDSEIKTVVVSETALISDDDHRAATAARQAAINSSLTDRARVVALSEQNTAMRQQISSLESYIASRLD